MEKQKNEEIKKLLDELNYKAYVFERLTKSYFDSVQNMKNDMLEICNYVLGGGHNDK